MHSLSAWRSEKLQKVYHYIASDRQTWSNFGSIFLNIVRFTSCWLLTSEVWPRPNQPNPVKHNRTTCYGWQFSQRMRFSDPPPLCFELYSNLGSKDVTDGISVVSPRESVAVAVEPGNGRWKNLTHSAASFLCFWPPRSSPAFASCASCWAWDLGKKSESVSASKWRCFYFVGNKLEVCCFTSASSKNILLLQWRHRFKCPVVIFLCLCKDSYVSRMWLLYPSEALKTKYIENLFLFFV